MSFLSDLKSFGAAFRLARYYMIPAAEQGEEKPKSAMADFLDTAKWGNIPVYLEEINHALAQPDMSQDVHDDIAVKMVATFVHIKGYPEVLKSDLVGEIIQAFALFDDAGLNSELCDVATKGGYDDFVSKFNAEIKGVSCAELASDDDTPRHDGGVS